MFREDLLADKRILVTGGGTGLGKAMAARYAELGADVILSGRRQSVLDEAAREINARGGGRAIAIPCDIRDYEAVERLIATIWDEHGPLTGLVNNAAGNFVSKTEDLSPRGFNAIASIVFNGTFYVTNAVGKRWIAEKRKGNILSILVTWVWTGSAYVVPSAMSKSGIKAMTQSLAVEWAPFGIRVNAIAPGTFPTPGASDRLTPLGNEPDDGEMVPMGRAGEMSELTNLATFLMADGVDYLTGQIIAIDGAAWMAGPGTFWQLRHLSDENWKQMRDAIKAANAKDKADRSG